MTNEQAKSELMQLYGSLSEEKKMALDVLMAQADGKYINIQDAISEIREMAKWHTGDAFNADRVIQHLKQLSSVAIPSAYKGMTNGEVIKMLYPQGEIVKGLYGISGNPLICVNLKISTECSEMVFTEDWWNSPYEPQKSKG